MKDKVVLITGAAGGLGRAFAQAFSKAGAKIALADLNLNGLAETSEMIDTESIAYQTNVSKICKDSNGSIIGVQLVENQFIETDLVVVGIGVLPNDELAKSAGLTCQNGIEVNEFLQTNDESVYAIGDCARYWNAFAGQKMRVESVQNAVDQAKCVAKNIMGERIAYHAVPWFWTNQYDLKLQMAGMNLDFEHYEVKGDVSIRKFSVYYYKKHQLIGVDSLNRPADHLAARKLLQVG
jgi:3-phenylpropionate/trans-cinnamate dioxygenase ferredoxin reductase subunit